MSSATLFLAVCRATILLAGVWAAVGLWRKAPAVRRHALLGACAALLFLAWLPGLPHPAVTSAISFPFDIPAATHVPGAATSTAAPPAADTVSWPQTLALVYFAGVAFSLLRLAAGWLALRRRLRDAVGVTPHPLAPRCLESAVTDMPFTAGFLRPVIVLPPDWRSWPAHQLSAVMAHESAHISRKDALYQFLGRVQQALFWFHPGAAWLNRKLEDAADEACDDIAIHSTGDRVAYAEALWAFASRPGSPLPAPALPMAKPGGISARIERSLNGPSPRLSLTAHDVLRLALVLVPLALGAAALHFAPPSQVTDREMLAQGYRLTEAQAAQLETALKSRPDDDSARGQLIAYYFTQSRKEERLRHILWLTEHQAGSPVLASRVSQIEDADSLLDDRVAYNSARNLWLQHIPLEANNPQILFNAACFFQRAEPERSLSLLKQVRTREPANNSYVGPLAATYRRLLPKKSYADELLKSNDAELLRRLAPQLSSTGSPEMAALGQQLAARATSLGAQPMPAARSEVRQTNSLTPLEPIETPAPVYPPLAKQARISGLVRFEIEVAPDGSVTDARLISGHPLLVPAAAEAVRKYRYRPQSAPARTFVSVPFIPSEVVAAPDAYRIGAGISSPVLIQKIEPAYPEELRDEKVEGTIVLNVVIGTDGMVQSVSLDKGEPRFAAAALDAVRQWRFKPGTKDGKPVKVQAKIEVNFRLN